jgi:hypothetical protein
MKKVLEPIIQRIMYAAIVTLSLAFVVSGQQQDRVVDWQPIKSEAKVLEIVDIKVAGETFYDWFPSETSTNCTSRRRSSEVARRSISAQRNDGYRDSIRDQLSFATLSACTDVIQSA